MELTAKRLSQIVSGELVGDASTVLTGVNSLSNAKKNDISFLGNLKYLHDALTTKAGVTLIPLSMDISQFKGKNIIKVKYPQYSYSIILGLIEREKLEELELKIHNSAFISDAIIGPNAYIGQNVVIEKNVKLGSNVRIFPNVYIGKNATIGSDCIFYPNVVIREDTVIGDRVIIQPGAIIGGDGFGFVNINGKVHKIPQIGCVHIGNDVEIGANTTIDRATFDSTKIGDGTKIDNLVQIAHNVEIGKNCIIVAQAGISGSTHIGNNVTIAGQVGIAGHLQIGDDVIIASQAAITNNVKDGQKVGGNPMMPLNQSIKTKVLIRKLPDIYDDLRKIKKELKGK